MQRSIQISILNVQKRECIDETYIYANTWRSTLWETLETYSYFHIHIGAFGYQCFYNIVVAHVCCKM